MDIGMELLERNTDLAILGDLYQQLSSGEGHTVFVMGEAGVGKTSLVQAFLRQQQANSRVYVGACDFLFTPTPLGPLYDIARKVSQSFWELLKSEADRVLIFSSLIQELELSSTPVILVFEDVHWADEATFDLIRFLARRISDLPCLFVLTFREDEIGNNHPLRIVMGELPHTHVTRLHLQPLSESAVKGLAQKAGYSGEEVYRLTGGNPFYVNEILASYSAGVPDNIKDAVLSVFNKLAPAVREIWELISVIPNRMEPWLLGLLVPDYAQLLETCFQKGILIAKGTYIFFKHELFRKTIEESLSHPKRILFHKKLLESLLAHPDKSIELARLVHHAKNAHEDTIVARLAPEAGRQAASLGAHQEACQFYLTAITYSSDLPYDELARLYECHAYECYLTNQIREAINSQQKALDLWKAHQSIIKEGNALRFLSRLWWFEGNGNQSVTLALASIEVLENGFPTRERALAYSNLAQLKMLSDNAEEGLYWGQNAIDLAHKLEDEEILCHALNNVGTIQLSRPALQQSGESHLRQSLSLAVKHGYHEHVARAYTNLGSAYVLSKKYPEGRVALQEGLAYCETRDLDAWTYYMLSWKARFHLETGEWDQAEMIAQRLLKNPHHPSIVRIGALVVAGKLRVRKGEESALPLLKEAEALALPTLEVQRMVPVATGLLEHTWITGQSHDGEIVNRAVQAIKQQKNPWHISELAYWLHKTQGNLDETEVLVEPYHSETKGEWEKAASLWKEKGCPYEQALSLFAGTVEDQKEALTMLENLGAIATAEMLKQRMRSLGVKSIPRGPRPSTRENPAQLTNRQIDVLHLLKEGLQNQEIAEKLFISSKTVDHHISAILSKLDVNSRTKAVAEASRLGILK